MRETAHSDTDVMVTLTIDAGVATVTLDNPAKRNALSRRLVADLATQLTAARDNDEVAVIVLTHTGTTFCAGADLSEAKESGVSESAFPDLLARLATSPKPTIAKIDGAVRAGGIGLMAACDIVVSTERASFGFPEVRLGVVAAVISTVVLPLISARGARELFLTGDPFDADRAQHEGLITAVVHKDDLDATVERYTRSLRLGGPDALAATKHLLLAAAGISDVENQLRTMHRLSAYHFESDEGKEGISAVQHRRVPEWARDTGLEEGPTR